LSPCEACPNQSASWAYAVLIVLVVIIAILVMFWAILLTDRSLLQMSKERDEELRKQRLQAQEENQKAHELYLPIQQTLLTTELRNAPTFTYKMKILLGFLQILTNLAFVVDVPWPTIYSRFINLFSFVNLDFVPWQSVGCVSRFDFYTKLIITIVTPIGVLFLLIVGYLVPKMITTRTRYMQQREGENAESGWGGLSDANISVWDKSLTKELSRERAANKRTRRKFWKLVLFTAFLIYPGVSSTILSMFMCEKVNDTIYLKADFSLRCGDKRWISYLPAGIIGILVYPIGIPAFFFYLLRRYRNRLQQPDIQAELGFLYLAYSPASWWFELVDMLHKLTLTSLVAFLPGSGQMPAAMTASTLYTVILLVSHPYIRKDEDRLHILAQTELLLFLLSGWILVSRATIYLDPATDVALSLLLITLTITMCCVGIGLSVFSVYQLTSMYLKQRKEKKTHAAEKARQAQAERVAQLREKALALQEASDYQAWKTEQDDKGETGRDDTGGLDDSLRQSENPLSRHSGGGEGVVRGVVLGDEGSEDGFEEGIPVSQSSLLGARDSADRSRMIEMTARADFRQQRATHIDEGGESRSEQERQSDSRTEVFM
jgi:TRAP-type C4-dicarboxylate transport system permease small subunit